MDYLAIAENALDRLEGDINSIDYRKHLEERADRYTRIAQAYELRRIAAALERMAEIAEVDTERQFNISLYSNE